MQKETGARVPHIRSTEVHKRSSNSLCASVRERVCLRAVFQRRVANDPQSGRGVLFSSQE